MASEKKSDEFAGDENFSGRLYKRDTGLGKKWKLVNCVLSKDTVEFYNKKKGSSGEGVKIGTLPLAGLRVKTYHDEFYGRDIRFVFGLTPNPKSKLKDLQFSCDVTTKVKEKETLMRAETLQAREVWLEGFRKRGANVITHHLEGVLEIAIDSVVAKSFKKRYCVLYDGFIVYFSKINGGDELGRIRLNRRSTCFVNDLIPERFVFSICPNDTQSFQYREHNFAVKSQDALFDWFEAITRACKRPVVPRPPKILTFDPNSLVKQGYMFKNYGGGKHWIQRWYVLTAGPLGGESKFECFKDETAQTLQSNIEIASRAAINILPPEKGSSQQYTFAIIENARQKGSKIYRFATTSEPERKSWMLALHMAQNTPKYPFSIKEGKFHLCKKVTPKTKKKWKEVGKEFYFVLLRDRLLGYKSKGQSSPSHRIDLTCSTYCDHTAFDEKRRKFTFAITRIFGETPGSGGHTFVMATQEEKDADDWVGMIKAVLAALMPEEDRQSHEPGKKNSDGWVESEGRKGKMVLRPSSKDSFMFSVEDEKTSEDNPESLATPLQHKIATRPSIAAKRVRPKKKEFNRSGAWSTATEIKQNDGDY